MKVCLVVCLALAHLAAGRIFKKHSKQNNMQSLTMEPLDYIDPTNYNQQLQQMRLFQEAQRYPVNENAALNPETAEVSSHEQVRANGEYSPKKSWNVPQYASGWSGTKHIKLNQPIPYGDGYANVKQVMFNRPAYGDSVADVKYMYNQPLYADAAAWKNMAMAFADKPISDKNDAETIFKDTFDTVKDFTEEEKKAYHEAYLAAATNEDTHLNATALLQKYQYAVEQHTVKTDDGYILTLFRIPPKQKTRDVQKRPVVFLMHGLLGSADDWLLMGPGKSLAYLLADADFDVWMGNARGSKYSRRHVSKHPAQPDFWQFSIDEIALMDLPAMIDYALNTTNQEKMYYVGFSEGTTAFFALASARREYNDKIAMMYALSPMVYMSHVRSPLMKMISPASPSYERLHQALGHGEFKPTPELIQSIGGDMLTQKTGCKHVGGNVNFALSGMVDNYNADIVPIIEGHLPAGASTRMIKQYGQAVASQEFRRYDYGPAINMEVYGSAKPPKYEMSAVQAPVTLYYSAADWLAQPADVEQLGKELPHLKEAHQVPLDNYNHLDFQFSRQAPEAIYQRLIASIQNNQQVNYSLI